MKVSSIVLLSQADRPRAEELAEHFSIPLMDATALERAKARELQRFVRANLSRQQADASFIFLLSNEGLSLVLVDATNFLSIQVDFYGATVSYRRHKGGGKSQMIARAVGLNSGEPLQVLDATAGLGRDAFVLASLGCQMTLLERVPEVRALLVDGLRKAQEFAAVNDAPLSRILSRMQLIESDSRRYLQTLAEGSKPDVIYLDPMFPVRTKTAQVKKEMRVFHQLVGTDPDAADLLPVALAAARKRVVVKRPRTAPWLCEMKPSFAYEGKSNRYDIYLLG